MLSLSFFGVSVLVTFIIIIVCIGMYGIVPPLYIFYAINGSFVQWITSKFGKQASEHSSTFKTLLLSFMFIELAVLFSVVYGVLNFFYNLITGNYKIDLVIEKPLTSGSTLLYFVIVLLILKSIQLVRYTYLTIWLFRTHKESVDTIFYKNLWSSLISYLLVFIYLISFYQFFNRIFIKGAIGLLPTIAGCLFLIYLLYYLCKNSYTYFKYRKQIFPNYKFKDYLNLLPFYIFDLSFLWFFYVSAQYLWFSKIVIVAS